MNIIFLVLFLVCMVQLVSIAISMIKGRKKDKKEGEFIEQLSQSCPQKVTN